MNKRTFTKLALAAIVAFSVAICVSNGLYANDRSTEIETDQLGKRNSQQDIWQSFQQGTAAPGSNIHNWLKYRFGSVSEYHSVNYMIINSINPSNTNFVDIEQFATDWIDSKRLQANDINRNKAELISIDDPVVPQQPGGKIGDTSNRTASCVNVGSFRQGTVTYNWEWKYTKDTNGDNKPDSDPAWVLTDIEVEFYTPFTQPNCT